jgi:pilus assembly protein CpaF
VAVAGVMSSISDYPDLVLHDDKIMEIMVNGPYAVYVERRGKLQKIDVMFDSSDHLMRTIHRMLLPLGQQVDAATPVVSARLPDGSLVHVVIPPLAIDGPSVTIRKFGENRLTIADLIRFGSLTDSMADLIEACIVSRLNILISGGTGSGKTTVLNVLARCIPDDERIVTVEEAATIQIPKEHVVRLEARPPDSSGKGAVTTRDLVQTAARMRPERIIIGELSGAEALDTIRLMSEGHDGSITTMHADTPHDALARLEMMILFNNPGVPEDYVRRLIATSIDLIVQQTRLADGQRKVSYITELRGVEQGEYVLHDIFALEIAGQTPEGKYMTRFRKSPYRPHFADRLESFGFQLSPDIFKQSLPSLGRNNQSQKHTRQQSVRTTIARLLRTGLRRIGRWVRK